MIRAMSPELFIIDEIATHQDVEALLDGMKAGVSLVCTAHGTSYEDVCARLFFHSLIEHELFDYCVTLDPLQRGAVTTKFLPKRVRSANAPLADYYRVFLYQCFRISKSRKIKTA